MYDIQGNLQDGSQVVVSIIFENKCDSFLKSMEFNVLDSLNSKLQRPEGSGPHDGLTVPFQLPPGQSIPPQGAPVVGNNENKTCKIVDEFPLFFFPPCVVNMQLLTNGHCFFFSSPRGVQ